MASIRRKTTGLAGLLRLAGVAFATLAASVAARGQGPAVATPVADPIVVASIGTPSFAPSDLAGRGDVPTALRVEMGPFGTIADSLFGDVYAEGRWRPLALHTFFREGWSEPWAGAPSGRDDRTPRGGWLGAFDGVFYRLYLTTFGTTKDIDAPFRGDSYFGTYSIFLPFSRRFEVLLDVPFVAANGTLDPRHGYKSSGGDLTIAPRFLLSETRATSQVLALLVRAPTGSKDTGNGIAALTPRYEFWTNPVGPWVVRGSAGFFVPVNRAEVPARTAFAGGLAAGRYFTPHDVPFGDLVLYAAANINVPLDGTASRGTVATVGPGTRFHIAKDFYFLNYWEFPVSGPHKQSYAVQFALLKTF